MFVHTSAMTQIKADLMGKYIATSCWLNKETLWRLRYLESFPSDYQVPDAFQESIRCGIKAFQLIIITELCSTGGLKCEQNAYPICFSGLSDIRSGMVWTWSPASFQETTEIFTVAHNCHGKLKFTTASSNSPRQIQIRWPTTVTANKIYHGKFKFAMANSNSPWKIKIYHGKFTWWSSGKTGV